MTITLTLREAFVAWYSSDETETIVPGKQLRTTWRRVLSGRSDANIAFDDLIALLRAIGFDERTRGNHHILWREKLPEIIILQPIGSKAKRYQVRQVRGILLKMQAGA